MIKVVLGVGVFALFALGGFAVTNSNPSIIQQKTKITQTNVNSFVAQTSSVFKTEKASVLSLGENVVFLEDNVSRSSIDRVISELEQLRNGGFETALLVISSPGGSVLHGAELINYMEASDLKVDTYCRIMCASMGFHILQAGKKRYSSATAVIMAHPASGGVSGTVENMKTQIDMIKRLVDRMDAKAAKRAGIDFKEFKTMVADNIWIDGIDAKDMKLVDSIAILQYDVKRRVDLSISPDRLEQDDKTYNYLFDIK